MSDKVAGDAAKLQGNEAYKARNFEAAVGFYEQAWELNHDITYLNNLSGECAVRAEEGDTRGELDARGGFQVEGLLPWWGLSLRAVRVVSTGSVHNVMAPVA
jgi:hypothetical protein